MKTHKIACIVLAIIMAGVLAACAGGGNSGDGSIGSAPPPSPSESDAAPSASPANSDKGTPPPADSDTPSPSETPASPSDSASPAPSPSESASQQPSPSPAGSAPPKPSPSESASTSPSASPTPAPTEGAPPSPTPTDSAGGSPSGLSGPPQELLDKLVADTTDIIKAADGFMYMSFTSEVTPELSQNAAGISEADFGTYLVAAASSMAGIGSQAHQIVLYQAKDAGAAAEVKKIVAGRVNGKDGYDSMKWICVWPDQSVIVESGAYVLLIASRKDIADAAIGVFTTMGGSTGQPDVFYEHTGA